MLLKIVCLNSYTRSGGSRREETFRLAILCLFTVLCLLLSLVRLYIPLIIVSPSVTMKGREKFYRERKRRLWEMYWKNNDGTDIFMPNGFRSYPE